MASDIDHDGLTAPADEVSAVAVACDSATVPGATQLVSRAREALGRIDVWFGKAAIPPG